MNTTENNLYSSRIAVYYRPEQAVTRTAGYSRSPAKPALFMKYIAGKDVYKHLQVYSDWEPFQQGEFLIAHKEEYVNSFFNGSGCLSSSNGLTWSTEFRDSVCFTNASLFHSIEHAVLNPEQICLSPVSGFHHARPESGGGFCTFSGQVISALKIFSKYGLRAAWIDLDGHFGNSIEDTRSFAPELNFAVPVGMNINPVGLHETYLHNLKRSLDTLKEALIQNQIHYVCFAHGADSHEWDDLGVQCSTEEWLFASRLVYNMIHEASSTLGRPVPLILSLFGGYRKDHYESVLELHLADLSLCLDTLCGQTVFQEPRVRMPA